MQELGIDLIVLDQPMGDTGNQCGISARVDGQPLIGMAHNGIVHTRVDDVNLALGLLAHMRIVVMGNGTTLTRLCRARAEHQDQLSILCRGKRRTARLLRAVHVRGYAGDLRRRVAVVELQEATHGVHHALERTSGGSGNTGRIRQVHGLVAVLLDDFFELRGRQIDSLVPGNALELALAALADALHGIVDTIGMVHPATIRATAQARTRLRVIEPGILARAGVDPHDLVVLHMELQAATARTVDGAMAPRDLLLGLCERRLGCAEQVRTRCSSAADGGQSTQRTRRFDERAAVHAWHVLHCLPLHSFLLRPTETTALTRAAAWHTPCTALTPCATPASLVRARLPSKRIW